jgi:hypothetical protein
LTHITTSCVPFAQEQGDRFRGADHRRRNRTHAARHPALDGRPARGVGMIATGLMIAIVPVIIVYAFFSEKLIKA